MRLETDNHKDIFLFPVSSSQMVNMADASGQHAYSKTKLPPPAIHIAALPSRQNPHAELHSFSIPLQYSLGTFKKIGEEIQLDVEAVPENIPQNWDVRNIPNFNLMNLKPLLETRENIDLSELKYEDKNESVGRINFGEVNNSVSIETEDILGKETVNEGQTISPDFEIQRYQNYNENEKRYREQGFDEAIMEGRNEFVCESDFLCKNSFGKDDEKRGEFEECNLLDTDNNVGMSNFESNL